MGKSNLLILAALTVGIGISGCNHKSSSDEKIKELEKQWDDEQKRNDEIFELAKKSLEQGGQPAQIKVSGIIVKDNSQTDIRITLISKPGIGKDGTQPKIADTNKPVLSSKYEQQPDRSKMSELKNLISLGCDDKKTEKVAKIRGLKIEKIPEPISDGILHVSAKTILLCSDGDIEKIKNFPKLNLSQFLSFNADELILDQVNFSLAGVIGSLTFTANKLLLNGSSQISTKALIPALEPRLEFNILKEISSNENGKLVLMTLGSDYSERDGRK